jgi:tRNA1(Val) A37 N6-methylase TrmN6
VVPTDPQKAHARFELRGDISDYALAARAALADGGRFLFCFPTVQRDRAELACAAAELAMIRSRDVIPRAGAAPLFTLFACRRSEEPGPAHVFEPPHVVRDEHGEPTAMHRAARAALGF